MVIVSLNLSRRPFKFGFRPLQKLVDRALGRYDGIVVHSTPEIAGFAELHDLDRSRFQVIPWGFDLPKVENVELPELPRRYVCVIGRNNRDFATVGKALEDTGIGGVFVGADKSLSSDERDIRCFESLPFPQCLKIMEGALANVILVKDSGRGAGHITAVSGMLLEKPHIFSDVPTLSEYLRDGMDGIAVPLRDVTATREAMLRLGSDPALASRMGRAGRRRALAEMSHERFTERLVSAILGAS
jgi:glycosyltransferase involved in cell wall biosynthesis